MQTYNNYITRHYSECVKNLNMNMAQLIANFIKDRMGYLLMIKG